MITRVNKVNHTNKLSHICNDRQRGLCNCTGASTQASPRARTDGHALSSAASAHTAQTHSSKNASSADSATTVVALSQEELAALSEELEVLKEKPRSQMVRMHMQLFSLSVREATLADLNTELCFEPRPD